MLESRPQELGSGGRTTCEGKGVDPVAIWGSKRRIWSGRREDTEGRRRRHVVGAVDTGRAHDNVTTRGWGSRSVG